MYSCSRSSRRVEVRNAFSVRINGNQDTYVCYFIAAVCDVVWKMLSGCEAYLCIPVTGGRSKTTPAALYFCCMFINMEKLTFIHLATFFFLLLSFSSRLMALLYALQSAVTLHRQVRKMSFCSPSIAVDHGVFRSGQKLCHLPWWLSTALLGTKVWLSWVSEASHFHFSFRLFQQSGQNIGIKNENQYFLHLNNKNDTDLVAVVQL